MTKRSSPLQGVYDAVDRLVGYMWQWLLVMLASGWLLGVSVYSLLQWELGEYLLKNNLEPEERSDAMAYGAMGVVAVFAIYLGVWLKQWLKDRSVRPVDAFRRFTRVWFPTLTAPLVTALFVGNMESKAAVLALLFIAIVTVFVMAAIHLRPDPISEEASAAEQDTPPGDEAEEPEAEDRTEPEPEAAPADDTPSEPSGSGDDGPTLPKWYRDPFFRTAAALCIIYGSVMSYLSLVEHWSVATHAYDLGIYDNVLWRTINGDLLGCSLCKGGNDHTGAGHFDPILIVISPLYALWPRAEALLLIQSWWLASTGIPLYLIARRVMPEAPRYCVGIVAIFFLHPALHGINLFDFHSLALCVPLVVWCVWAIDAGAWKRFILFFVLLLLTREDMPLLACFIGLYAISKRRPLWGALMITVAIAYLIVVKTKFMGSSDLLTAPNKQTASHVYYFKDMIPYPEEGMKGLVVSTFTNPAFVVKVIFLNAKKNLYVFGLLIPLLFMPLFGRHKRIMMLYGLAFVGLVTRQHVYSFHFQYSSIIFPFLVMAIPEATKRITDFAVAKGLSPSAAHMRRTLLWGMMTAVLLFTSRFGAFVPNNSFKGGWNRLNRYLHQEDRERYAELRDMCEQIPQDATVSASSALVPHVSNRELIYKYPKVAKAEWLLLNIGSMNSKKKSKRKLERLKRKYAEVATYEDIGLYHLMTAEERKEAAEERRQAKRANAKKARSTKPKRPTKRPKSTRPRPGDDDDEVEDDDEDDDEIDEDDPSERARGRAGAAKSGSEDDEDDDQGPKNPNED